MQFRVKVPASSANLGPGFDAIGIALDLWNTVTIDTDGTAGDVTNSGSEAFLLDGRENLTIKAMKTLARDYGKRLPAFSLQAETEVPIARGLGSSAAALVAGLVAANYLLELNLDQEELFAHAWRIEGHGDNVGAALYGGAILAVPNVPYATRLWAGEERGYTAVVFIPEVTGATWAARAALPNDIPHADAAFNVATASGLAVGLVIGDTKLIGAGMNDRLHEPYRARLFSHLNEMKATAREHGAIGACLSGAGPTVLAFVPHERVDAVIAAMRETSVEIAVPGRVTELAPTACGATLVHDLVQTG
ncbi:MAG TPA: homoserine kinase [Thermomicrobiales bacterium]|nr:homoserine kinase [Thermomicrobiales bacterium]